MQQIGRLEILRRYPIKSMKGEELKSVSVSFSGVLGDRVHAFIDPTKQGNFPWLSARQVPEMLLFEPRFEEAPDNSVKYPSAAAFQVLVKTPEGETYEAQDPGF